MITAKEAFDKAWDNRQEFQRHSDDPIYIDRSYECKDFYAISFVFLSLDENGEEYLEYPPGGMIYNIRKSDGAFLDYIPYFPGNEYAKLLEGKIKLEVPKEYRLPDSFLTKKSMI